MSGSGADIPYHLRTAKAADRSLFVDLLRRLERWKPLDRHVYASMGGYPMADHHRVHRVLGLRNMLSFDENARAVPRQLFNRPTKDCRCVGMTSGEFVADPRAAYASVGLGGCPNHIAWLDYTKPADLRLQLDELVSLVQASDVGDLLRITLNANERAIKGVKPEMKQPEERLEARLKTLEGDLGDYLPEDVTPDDLTTEVYPLLLARLVRNAVCGAAASTSRIVPLSIVTYADGQRMMATTMAVVSQEDADEGPHEAANLNSWPLASREWSDVHDLRIATLTSRERELLDRNLPAIPAKTVLKNLEFSLFQDMDVDEAAAYLDRYEGLLRFYPDFVVTT